MEPSNQAFKQVQEMVFDLASRNGWWDDYSASIGVDVAGARTTIQLNVTPKARLEKLMMVVSEVTEALDDVRQDRMDITYREDGKPEGYPIELADAVIRLFDLAEADGIDLYEVIMIKHRFNETRPRRHGDLPF